MGDRHTPFITDVLGELITWDRNRAPCDRETVQCSRSQEGDDGKDILARPQTSVPQIGSRVPGKEDLEQIRKMCALHKRLALVQMTEHEFLDAEYHKERTTFADGTTVTVDWNDKTVQIKPELN